MSRFMRKKRREIQRKLTGVTKEQTDEIIRLREINVREIEDKIYERAVNDITNVYIYAIRMEFGFGKDRLKRVQERAAKTVGDLAGGWITMDIIQELLYKETKTRFTPKYVTNQKLRKEMQDWDK